MNATRTIRPVNGIGPGIGRGARYEAEKRSRDLARQRKQELERAKLTAASHGIFEGRRLEAIAQESRTYNGPAAALRYHVTGAIERGKAEAIAEVRA